MNSAVAGQTTWPSTLAPYTPEPPLAGKSPLGGPQPGAIIGFKNTVTVSTSTATNVCGWKHLRATVTVREGPSPTLESTLTPLASVFKMSAVAASSPTITVAFGTASP